MTAAETHNAGLAAAAAAGIADDNPAVVIARRAVAGDDVTSSAAAAWDQFPAAVAACPHAAGVLWLLLGGEATRADTLAAENAGAVRACAVILAHRVGKAASRNDEALRVHAPAEAARVAVTSGRVGALVPTLAAMIDDAANQAQTITGLPLDDVRAEMTRSLGLCDDD